MVFGVDGDRRRRSYDVGDRCINDILMIQSRV
jgi:hypothetical protein